VAKNMKVLLFEIHSDKHCALRYVSSDGVTDEELEALNEYIMDVISAKRAMKAKP
jgi:hypothetical protein